MQEMERFPLRLVWFWELMLLVTAIVIFAGVLWIFAPYTLVWYICLFVLGGVYLFFAVFYIPMYYVSAQFGMDEQSFVIRSGVFVERIRYQRRSQISVAVVCNNPLSYPFSLSSLMIYAPGSTLVIPLMDRKRAYEIAEMLEKS